jgi:opacity protein-like surface antigen
MRKLMTSLHHAGCTAFMLSSMLNSSAGHCGHFLLDLAVVGSELTAPALSAQSDNDLDRGLGLAAAVGYRHEAVRLELEWMRQQVTSLAYDDTLDVGTLFVNAFIDIALVEKIAVFIGLGAGNVDVHARLDTCRVPGGCTDFAGADDTGEAFGRQVIIGASWALNEQTVAYLGFRWLKSGTLGLVDRTGMSFENDRLDMAMSFIGLRW